MSEQPSFIPFNRPFIVGRELFYISQAVLGGHLAGDGKFTRLCNRWMEERFGARRVLLTHSCTAALEMAAILADVGPEDEVIMPAFTFVSTATAFALRGARIRFIDIRPDTLNLDERLLTEAVNERTKAVVAVHYGGVGCEMDAIMAVAEERELVVIEDAAQGVDAAYKGRYLGTIGQLGAFSFHETKNYISGEGGALLINDERFIERAEIIREKGTNRSKFFRGEVDKYTWVDIGSSYLPSEIVAAFLYAQLEESAVITAKRHAIFQRYREGFMDLASKGVVQILSAPPECRHNAHMFFLIVSSEAVRDGLISHLKSRGILAVFHYLPLHTSPMGRRLGCDAAALPVTERVSARLLRLPYYFELTPEDQDRVIYEVRSYLTSSQRNTESFNDHTSKP